MLIIPGILLAKKIDADIIIPVAENYRWYVLVALLILSALEVLFVRNKLATLHMIGKSTLPYWIGCAFLSGVLNLAIIWGHYFLFSYMDWMKMGMIKCGLSLKSRSIIIKKLCFFEIGPFYLSYSIYILLISLILYFIITILLKFFKGRR